LDVRRAERSRGESEIGSDLVDHSSMDKPCLDDLPIDALPDRPPAPIFMGLFLFCGLLWALLSDGLGRYFSWLSVGSPVFASLWFYLRRYRGAK
jgi:hypothetical protein